MELENLYYEYLTNILISDRKVILTATIDISYILMCEEAHFKGILTTMGAIKYNSSMNLLYIYVPVNLVQKYGY